MATIEKQIFISNDQREVIIRTVRVDDAEEFLNLGKSIMVEEIYTLTQPDELNLTINQERDWLKSHIENPNHIVLVAEMDGKVVGQLDFSNGHKRRIAHTGEFGMGVDKDYRGLGIGGKLLEVMLNWASRHPLIEKINLCVHSTNLKAINMYEKYGFAKRGCD